MQSRTEDVLLARAASRTHDLSALLTQLTPHDADEAEHRTRMLALCQAPGDAFERDHFVPGHFTASAFIVSPAQDALLLIFHAKLARWLQPGGHIEPQDGNVLAAARREAEEEVGLSQLELLEPAPFDLDIHAIPALRGDPAHAHFDVRFLFRAPSLVVRAASDAKAARWVPLDAIDLELSDRSVMRAVEKLRR
jgi:8-oxo-dGTP pyrophosphatase MutT (NUDIX family)